MVHLWFGIEPENLCNQHLRGEHNQIHKLIGWMEKKNSIDGWIENNYIQLKGLYERHQSLVHEMLGRNMNHNSPIIYTHLQDLMIGFYTIHYEHAKIDRKQNRECLKQKCDKCRKNMEN